MSAVESGVAAAAGSQGVCKSGRDQVWVLVPVEGKFTGVCGEMEGQLVGFLYPVSVGAIG